MSLNFQKSSFFYIQPKIISSNTSNELKRKRPSISSKLSLHFQAQNGEHKSALNLLQQQQKENEMGQSSEAKRELTVQQFHYQLQQIIIRIITVQRLKDSIKSAFSPFTKSK